MDFKFTEREKGFRDEILEFLDSELPSWWRGHYNEDDEAFAVVGRVTAGMAGRGWLTMHWPREYGGREAPIWEQVVMMEEMLAHYEPRGSQYMSTNWIGPSIMLFGSDEQKTLHLPMISAGKALWCQGFSEPDAGSDLASLRTRAVRDGDEYVVNGEKIWTSHTPRGQWLFLLARTDPDAPKHKGISIFLLPMDTPGIRVVPIRSMTGSTGEFAHVFLDNVRIPVSSRLGPENEGWNITMKALTFERLGVPYWIRSVRILNTLMSYATIAVVDGQPLWSDHALRQRFATLFMEAEATRLLWYRHISEELLGNDTTLISNLARIQGTICDQQVRNFAMEVLGNLGDVSDEEEDWVPTGANAGEMWFLGLTSTIGAGTLEVTKGIVATRGLGLPR